MSKLSDLALDITSTIDINEAMSKTDNVLPTDPTADPMDILAVAQMLVNENKFTEKLGDFAEDAGNYAKGLVSHDVQHIGFKDSFKKRSAEVANTKSDEHRIKNKRYEINSNNGKYAAGNVFTFANMKVLWKEIDKAWSAPPKTPMSIFDDATPTNWGAKFDYARRTKNEIEGFGSTGAGFRNITLGRPDQILSLKYMIREVMASNTGNFYFTIEDIIKKDRVNYYKFYKEYWSNPGDGKNAPAISYWDYYVSTTIRSITPIQDTIQIAGKYVKIADLLNNPPTISSENDVQLFHDFGVPEYDVNVVAANPQLFAAISSKLTVNRGNQNMSPWLAYVPEGSVKDVNKRKTVKATDSRLTKIPMLHSNAMHVV